MFGMVVLHSHDKIPDKIRLKEQISILVLCLIGSIVSGPVVSQRMVERVRMLTEWQPGVERQGQKEEKEEVGGKG